MERINALELRKSLGRVVAKLRRTGKPIILQRGKEDVAVLISLHDYQERFADREAEEARVQIMAEMDRLARPASDTVDAVSTLRQMRGE